MAGAALDLRLAGAVAEDERVRHRAVHEPERDARVHRVDQRALAFDEEELAAALGTLDDEPLGGAREEVRDDGVDRDPPPRDRDPRLPGRYEDRLEAALPRLEIELDGNGLLADRAVRADGEDDLRVDREVGARRDAQILGGRRRSRSTTSCRRASSESSGSSEMNSCRPLSTSSPLAMQLFRSSRHAGGKRPPCVATPTIATVGS